MPNLVFGFRQCKETGSMIFNLGNLGTKKISVPTSVTEALALYQDLNSRIHFPNWSKKSIHVPTRVSFTDQAEGDLQKPLRG